MSRVQVKVKEAPVFNEQTQYFQRGVEVECTRCHFKTRVCGLKMTHLRWCLGFLRDECPRDEENQYVYEKDEVKDVKDRS